MNTQLKRYAVLTLATFSFHLFFIWLMVEVFGLGSSLAFGLSISIVFIFGFFAMHYFVFESSRNGIKSRFSISLTVSLLFRLGEYFVFKGLQEVILINYLFLSILVLTLSFILKFFIYRLVFTRLFK